MQGVPARPCGLVLRAEKQRLRPRRVAGIDPRANAVRRLGQVGVRVEADVDHGDGHAAAGEARVSMQTQRRRNRAKGRLGVEGPGLLDAFVQGRLALRQQSLQQGFLDATGTRTVGRPPSRMVLCQIRQRFSAQPIDLGQLLGRSGVLAEWADGCFHWNLRVRVEGGEWRVESGGWRVVRILNLSTLHPPPIYVSHDSRPAKRLPRCFAANSLGRSKASMPKTLPGANANIKSESRKIVLYAHSHS